MRSNVETRRNRGGEEERTYLSIFRMDIRQRVILCATTRPIHVGVADCSQSIPEIDREATRTHSRSPAKTAIHFRRFSRVYGKSVADLRSRISVEKPEERCHFSRRDCRRYMPHRKICRRRKLD